MKFKNYSKQIITVVDNEYIHVYSSGIITLESSVENFLKINDAIEKTQLKKMLLQSTVDNNLDIEQMFELFKRLEAKQIPLLFDVSTAVVPSTKLYDEFQVFVSILKGLNVDLEIFNSIPTAVHWLKSKT